MNIIKYNVNMLNPNISSINETLPSIESPVQEEAIAEYSIKDELTISQEAKERFEKERYDYAEMLRQLKETEAPKEEDPLFKCIKIAMRIMNGDNVPSKDKSFLLEHQPQMYTNSMLLKRKNKDPKDYKTLIEDEEDEETSIEGSSESSSGESISTDSVEVGSEE